jgi:serine/threonine-protein phosphatase 2A activator
MATQTAISQAPLVKLESNKTHAFINPVKRIHTGQDVSTFLVSHAYRNLMQFLLQLNRAMFPSLIREPGLEHEATQTYQIGSSAVPFSEIILQLRKLLLTLDDIIDEVPLESGPRRFGNLSFRKWSDLVESRSMSMLERYLPNQVREFKHESEVDAVTELRGYFLGSFGDAQRLDYGTGHELSFLAFLACIWKLGGYPASSSGQVEREIVLGVIEPYVFNLNNHCLTTDPTS